MNRESQQVQVVGSAASLSEPRVSTGSPAGYLKSRGYSVLHCPGPARLRRVRLAIRHCGVPGTTRPRLSLRLTAASQCRTRRSHLFTVASSCQCHSHAQAGPFSPADRCHGDIASAAVALRRTQSLEAGSGPARPFA